MQEGPPTPISRGVEIQKSKVEEIRRRAIDRYTELTPLDNLLEERIGAALAAQPTEESLEELAGLFEKRRSLEEVEHALEEMILRTLDQQDELEARLADIEARINVMRSFVPLGR